VFYVFINQYLYVFIKKEQFISLLFACMVNPVANLTELYN